MMKLVQLAKAGFDVEIVDIRNMNHVFVLNSLRIFTTVDEIKHKIASLLHCEPSDVLLFDPKSPLTTLSNPSTLNDLNFDPSAKLLMSLANQSRGDIDHIRELIHRANNGTSGVYFLEDVEKHVKKEVFKPQDEEQGMPNNPQGFKNLREHFKPGQGVVREYFAYLMDVRHFCSVPRTRCTYLEDDSFHYKSVHYPKLGALQEFVQGGTELGDFSIDIFSDFEVQKIALLDMRVLNCDRNDGNILVVRKNGFDNLNRNGQLRPIRDANGKDLSLELIPIDHGYCLPAQLQIDSWDWVWFNSKQAKNPVCSEILEYFRSISIKDILQQISSKISISRDCEFLLRLSHAVIAEGLALGLSLHDIASSITRVNFDAPSELEDVISQSEDIALATLDVRSGRLSAHSMYSLPLAEFDSGTDIKPRARGESISFVPDFWKMDESGLDMEPFARQSESNSLAVESFERNSSSTVNDSNTDGHDVQSGDLSSDYELVDFGEDDEFVKENNTMSSSMRDKLFKAFFGGGCGTTSILGSFEKNLLKSSSPAFEQLSHQFEVDHDSFHNNLACGDSWDTRFNDRCSVNNKQLGRDMLDEDDGRFLTSSGNFMESSCSDIPIGSVPIPILTSNERDSISSSQSSNQSIRRMASFQGLESPAMYDKSSLLDERYSRRIEGSNCIEGLMKTRKMPKRIRNENSQRDSPEFYSLRLHYALQLMPRILRKKVKRQFSS